MWRGRDGRDVVDVAYGKQLDQGHVRDAKTQGARQAFAIEPGGRSYIQEIAIPWRLITGDGARPASKERLLMTAEPNFTVGTDGRLSIKDIFKPGLTPDRVFTFMASQAWGPATLLDRGPVQPDPNGWPTAANSRCGWNRAGRWWTGQVSPARPRRGASRRSRSRCRRTAMSPCTCAEQTGRSCANC